VAGGPPQTAPAALAAAEGSARLEHVQVQLLDEQPYDDYTMFAPLYLLTD
jgi:hypothetical protein